MSKPLARNFWRGKTLEQFTPAEWEALCDGCGRCCLLKLEDEDSGEIAYTDIACRLFDPQTCRCGNYALRSHLVRECVVLTPESVRETKGWMPKTCAYRILAENGDLPGWHPLVSGDPQSVRRAGISMRGACVPECEVDEEEYADRVIKGFL